MSRIPARPTDSGVDRGSVSFYVAGEDEPYLVTLEGEGTDEGDRSAAASPAAP
jgi:hypothetical protein